MKYLGIDYGEKNVGIAVSDDGGNLAFAKTVLHNGKQLLESILKICLEEKLKLWFSENRLIFLESLILL